ncbi:hypothetical protein B7P43_G01608 [Cryptotermes secundus]|uniref:Uncharacterized protein n=1 Tax=Cryptotermes secundus TaxID=105785 RepID=A0A2J7Q164_9NEOP|nr:hypothetical protein B7P43_G01608 [Cryptotermes secundus]
MWDCDTKNTKLDFVQIRMTVDHSKLCMEASNKQSNSATCLQSLCFNPEDGGSMFLQNIGQHLADCMVSHP